MTKIVLQFIKEEDGLMLFAPVDMDDEEALGDRKIIGAELLGDKATRTVLQNRSMRLYWRIICEKLNNSGWTKKKYYEVKEVDIGWTPESVGDDIWRGIQFALFGHRKTSKLTKKQVNRVHLIMDNHLSNTCGGDISTPFPDRYSQMQEQIGIK